MYGILKIYIWSFFVFKYNTFIVFLFKNNFKMKLLYTSFSQKYADAICKWNPILEIKKIEQTRFQPGALRKHWSTSRFTFVLLSQYIFSTKKSIFWLLCIF